MKVSDLPSEHFRPDVAVKDFVLPICSISVSSSNSEGYTIDIERSRLSGTSFLIGGNGFAITAAHVLDQIDADNATILRSNCDQEWLGFKVLESERHPNEDIAILRIDAKLGELPPSPLFIDGQRHLQSKRFQMWSYPDSVASEVKLHGLPSETWPVRPDLTFFSGYVHRRMSFSPNPSYSAYLGSIFFELSEVAGSCASGSPIIGDSPMSWEVFAIYVGEAVGQRKIGYGVSLEPIASWVPGILGRSVSEEAFSTAQRYLLMAKNNRRHL